jgi:hypothetical protein
MAASKTKRDILIKIEAKEMALIVFFVMKE